ncbi:hypothetical protein FF38_02218 [Lucilia cuprina]|uniref:Uncharacterized protein n=1 Tax=Lucilia cuprina TaxID=7375 RepID=A0A0L0BTF6_LUCCU|nr:hypothetical protein FF38_02218 [Lucilia cuprina]
MTNYPPCHDKMTTQVVRTKNIKTSSFLSIHIETVFLRDNVNLMEWTFPFIKRNIRFSEPHIHAASSSSGSANSSHRGNQLFGCLLVAHTCCSSINQSFNCFYYSMQHIKCQVIFKNRIYYCDGIVFLNDGNDDGWWTDLLTGWLRCYCLHMKKTLTYFYDN